MKKNYHSKPCQNCGHQDMHGEVAGCIAMVSTWPDRWCDCTAYVAPPTARDRARDTQEGRRRAAEGIAQAEGSYAMSVSEDGRDWTDRAWERVDALLDQGVEFTADDVTDVVGVAPSPSAIGGLFRAKRFKDRAEFVRFGESSRAVAHGRPLRVWKAKAPA